VRLRVLTYHRVANPGGDPSLDPRMISATPEGFALQMEHLRRHYAPVSLPEVLAAVESEAELPRRAVLVTFDDAYADFVEWAWPTLRSLGIPATMFVPTAYPDHPERSFWQDRLHWAFTRTSLSELSIEPGLTLPLRTAEERRRSLKTLMTLLKSQPNDVSGGLVDRVCAELGETRPPKKSVLSWEELRQLAAEGLALGAHSRHHPLLTRVGPDEVRREAVGARQDLEREIGCAPPVFCYPSGDHDAAVVAILAEEGFRVAFTTLDGQNDLRRAELLRLRRTNITPRTTPLVFRLRLMRLVSVIDGWRHRGQHGARRSAAGAA